LTYYWIENFIEQNLIQNIVFLYSAVFFLTILLVISALRIKSLGKKLKKLQPLGAPATSDLENINRALKRLEEKFSSSLQHVSVVRYNAFDDVGSDLSFSVAVLDERGNGFVISSLYGRNETRTFAKPVKGGKSEYKLSNEEVAAIRKALQQ